MADVNDTLSTVPAALPASGYLLHAYGAFLLGPADGTLWRHVLVMPGTLDLSIPGLPPPQGISGLSTPASRIWLATLGALESHAPATCIRVCPSSAATMLEAICAVLKKGENGRLLIPHSFAGFRNSLETELRRQGLLGIVVEVCAPPRLLPSSETHPRAEEGFPSFGRSLKV